MEIALYSNDPELQGICREIIRLTPGATYTRRTDFKTPPGSPSDLCIYDTALGSIQDLPDGSEIHNSILIVGRSELPQIRAKTLHLQAIVLLRPVNRARLEIAIEQSISEPRYSLDSDLMRINRDELLECLLHANLRLQEYDQNRSHFLARAIHELRAPLTSLNGYCGLLLDHKLGDLSNEQINVLGRMRRSVKRLARIVSTMFDLSIGRTFEYTPQYQVGNIVACVEQALHEVTPMLQDRQIQVDVHFLPAMGPLLFDTQQMEQVFVNLLDNSCKFTSRGGFVQVHGYPYFWERRASVNGFGYPGDRRRNRKPDTSPNSYRVDISDNGPGIPHDQLDRTFTEYSVYGGGNDRSGAGLGLAISRMFVRQHSGRLWAESKNCQGATFCVVLPHEVDTASEQSGMDSYRTAVMTH